MLKIARDGSVSDSADVQLHGHPGDGEPFHVEGGFAVPSDLEVLKTPAEGAGDDPQAEITELREEVAELEAEETAPPAHVPPRLPPRRTPPPGAG